MNFKLFFKLTLFIFFISFIKSYSQDDCSLRKDNEGIKVYLCESESSPFKTIKVYFEADGTPEAYASGVIDIANYKKWQSSIISIETLKKISERELIYYSEVDAPWPISNRDLIFHITLSQDESTKALTVTLEQLPNYIPKKEGIVRIPSANSVLTVTPLNEHRLSVSYILQVDPGGDIPPILANMFAANTPWNTFNNFRNLLRSKDIKLNPKLNIQNYTP